MVVIARNEAANVGRCVDSVLRQQHPHISEVLVVDGNSTDATQAVVLERAGRDARVRLMIEDAGATQRGPAAARNLGLAAASGELVQFLNADVEIGPGYVGGVP